VGVALLVFSSGLAGCGQPSAPAPAGSPADKAGAPPAAANPASAAPAQPLTAPTDLKSPPTDAVRSPSGLVSKVLSAGSGQERPAAHDRVKVHYTVWTPDGQVFASSAQRRAPAALHLADVMPGWAEGMQLMVVGERRRLWVPEKLAYSGKDGTPEGPVVVDVELLGIGKGTPPQPPPQDLAAPPADAERTESGLRHRLLGTPRGSLRPGPYDQVRVVFSGWDAQGRMFDSTQVRGGPQLLSLDHGIPGFREALALLAQGEKRRFWIPEELAYKHYPGTIRGPLVYDIELLEVIDMPEPPPAPKDVARPPKGAKRLPSGVAYRVIRNGEGKNRPGPTTKVEAHVSTWTPKGRLVDSTITRNEPARVGVDRIAPGLGQALQHMVVGDKWLLWVPKELTSVASYKEPEGPLVYEVELLAIYKKKIKVEWIEPEVLK